MHIQLKGVGRMSKTSDDMLTPNLYLTIENGTVTIGASLLPGDPDNSASMDVLKEIRGAMVNQDIPFEPLTHSMGTETVVTAVRLLPVAPDDGK